MLLRVEELSGDVMLCKCVVAMEETTASVKTKKVEVPIPDL